jgi:predicted transcriptional regulator
MLPSLNIIPERRRKLGLTQSKLADLAGVSQSYIAKLEAGNIEPSYLKVQSILEALERLEKREEVSAVEIMNKGVIGIQRGTPVQEAVELMKRYGYSQLPVMEGDHPVGSISEKILLDHILGVKEGKSHTQIPVEEIMEESFPLVGEDTPLSLITSLLTVYPAVLVQKKGSITGIITKADILTVIT